MKYISILFIIVFAFASAASAQRGDYMTAAEQDQAFGKAGGQVIRDGADMNRVVNARRGMQTAADGRLYTAEVVGKRPRLMPEQIYREAQGDRDEALRLLKRFSYIL